MLFNGVPPSHPWDGETCAGYCPGVGARPSVHLLDPRLLNVLGILWFSKFKNMRLHVFWSEADSTKINRRLRLFLIRKNWLCVSPTHVKKMIADWKNKLTNIGTDGKFHQTQCWINGQAARVVKSDFWGADFFFWLFTLSILWLNYTGCAIKIYPW